MEGISARTPGLQHLGVAYHVIYIEKRVYIRYVSIKQSQNLVPLTQIRLYNIPLL